MRIREAIMVLLPFVVVPVEEAEDGLEVDREWGDPGQLRAVLHDPLVPEELDVHVGVVDERAVVLVELVQVAEPDAPGPA
jgi:hypothetical protein